MRILPNIVSTALGLILLAGVMGAAHAEKRAATAASTRTKTTTTTTAPNCITPTLDAAGEGRRAYMRLNCYSCHGAGAHGGAMGPSLVGAADDTAEAVLNGEGGGMPSFKGYLCANDVANLTAYLQLLGTGTEPTFVRWWEPKPSR